MGGAVSVSEKQTVRSKLFFCFFINFFSCFGLCSFLGEFSVVVIVVVVHCVVVVVELVVV